MDPDLVDPIDAPVPTPTYPVNPNGQARCGTHVCACDDGLDNDGEGLMDGVDPESTGPYDDDESSFATGIPGDNRGRTASDGVSEDSQSSAHMLCLVARHAALVRGGQHARVHHHRLGARARLERL